MRSNHIAVKVYLEWHFFITQICLLYKKKQEIPFVLGSISPIQSITFDLFLFSWTIFCPFLYIKAWYHKWEIPLYFLSDSRYSRVHLPYSKNKVGQNTIETWFNIEEWLVKYLMHRNALYLPFQATDRKETQSANFIGLNIFYSIFNG